MVIDAGSSRTRPAAPFFADAFTDPRKSSQPFDEVSINPPSPETSPPLTLIDPLNRVALSDQSTTAPPDPAPPDPTPPSALIVAPAAMVSVAAVFSATSLYFRSALCPPR